MEREDRDLLIEIREDVKHLRSAFGPVMKQVNQNAADIIVIKRDRWWLFGIIAALGAGLASSFSGFWEIFKK